MFFHTIDPERPIGVERTRPRGPLDAVGLTASVNSDLAFSERAAGFLRAYLADTGLREYSIFYVTELDMEDLDEHLPAMCASAGAPVPTWAAAPAVTEGGAGLRAVSIDSKDKPKICSAGFLRLSHADVVLARWHWVDVEHGGVNINWLCAAPTAEHIVRLRAQVRRHRHLYGQSTWQIIRGAHGGERVPRETVDDDALLMAPRLRERFFTEISGFFGEKVAALYKSLGVPYRRGVLLHGPPGNGKTSLIRHLAAKVPTIPGMILRPHARFDSDDLTTVLKRWADDAPAILVIEDLDWLLERVNVSCFLNLLDGVETATTGGLLLIATTNHPEKLDSAVNNRPGRFDVVMEIPPPDESLRLEYLRRHLPGVGDDVIAEAAAGGEGLAFAHLQEIVRLAGLIAVNAGRSVRIDEDVRKAFRTVRESFDDAVRRFPGAASGAFGLAELHRKRAVKR